MLLPDAYYDRPQRHDPYLGAFAPWVCDRQRIVSASSFRRLQSKTQVFRPRSDWRAESSTGVAKPAGAWRIDDHTRTRLTHTLEVAHLARLIAAKLRLDERLAELAALAHDLGHPPFGHAGERALDACLKPLGGFNHNANALRVVDLLEHPYPEFPGLNLTHAVRLCLAHHETEFDTPEVAALRELRLPPPLEAHVVSFADRLAFTLHDVQDGLYAKLLDPDDLSGSVSFGDDLAVADADPEARAWRAYLRPAIERLQAGLIADFVEHSAANLVDIVPHEPPPPAILQTGAECLTLSDAGQERLDGLSAVLVAKVYHADIVRQADIDAIQIVSELYHKFVAEPTLLPTRYQRRLGLAAFGGVERVVADFVSGMTDRYALEQHTQLGGTGVSLD